MSEVEKMYKLANVKAKEYCDRDSDVCMNCCPEWENRQNCWKYKSVMPPFTAEKQLELIKWLAKRENLGCEEKIAISISKDDYCFVSMGLRILEEEQETYSDYCFGSKTFEIALAGLINCLWQDLTEEERKQIKEILSE